MTVSIVFVPKQRCVDEVSVVCDGNLTLGILAEERLGIDRAARTGCRIANMPDCDRVLQFFKDTAALAKNPANLPHTRETVDFVAIA